MKYLNTNKLKGTNIWINNDYSKKVQEERTKLVKHVKEARGKGERAFLKYNKLVINGKEYTLDEFGSKGRGRTGTIKRTLADRSPLNEDEKERTKKTTGAFSKNKHKVLKISTWNVEPC